MGDSQQKSIDFTAGEIAREELRNMLGMALLKVAADIYLKDYMSLLFNMTDGGRKGRLKRSYEQLASRPWGLCCHRNKAYSTAKKAQRLGLAKLFETWTAPGTQGPNEAEINWEGIRLILGFRPMPPHTECDPPHTECDPPHTECDPPHTECDASIPLFSSSDGAPAAAGPPRGGVRTGKSKVPPESVPIPPELDVPEFVSARDLWFAQRRARRFSLRADYVAQQYARLLPLGPTAAVACLTYTTDNDYQGVFPERFAGHADKVGSGQVFNPQAVQQDDHYGIM